MQFWFRCYRIPMTYAMVVSCGSYAAPAIAVAPDIDDTSDVVHGNLELWALIEAGAALLMATCPHK